MRGRRLRLSRTGQVRGRTCAFAAIVSTRVGSSLATQQPTKIVQRLGVTEHTVKTEVNRIYEKLEVWNRLALLALAIERGWVEKSKIRKAAGSENA